MRIQHKEIGEGKPCFIIAEAGINHNGDFKLAQELVLKAAEAGADAIKFQTHLPEYEMLRDTTAASYVGESLFDLLQRVSLSPEDHFRLKELAERLGLVNKVVPSDKLESEVFAFARELAKGPTKALGLAKLAINKAMESSLSEALEYVIYAQIICLQSEDHKEAVQAFLEKREPQFKGK